VPGDESNTTIIPPAEESLLAGVEPRIFRITMMLGVAGTAAFWLWRGAGWAGGFAIGAALSGLSFYWMKSAVSRLSELAAAPAPSDNEGANPRPRPGSGGTVFRFVLRYALIGVIGYVIFRSSVLSLEAFFAGLFVGVAAVLVEIGYQVWLGFRRA
jgi:hypothetical protein